jgi:hypothetical protein
MTCQTLVCNIHSKREIRSNETKENYYYINEGVFQSFSCIFNDIVNLNLIPFSTEEKNLAQNREMIKSKIFGQTV